MKDLFKKAFKIYVHNLLEELALMNRNFYLQK